MEILGNKLTQNKIIDLLEKKILPQTIIFDGISGIGKKQFAFKLFAKLLQTKSYQITLGNILNDNEPDFIFIDLAEKENNKLANFKDKFKPFNLTSYSNNGKVLLIDNAELMSKEIANFLLKPLEEPTPNSYYCLITSNSLQMIKTILSRSTVFSFNPLTEAELLRILKNIDEELADKFLLSDYKDLGSIGKVLNHIQNEEFTKKILTNTTDLINLNPLAIEKLITSFEKNKDESIDFINIFSDFLYINLLKNNKNKNLASLLENVLEINEMHHRNNLNPSLLLFDNLTKFYQKETNK